jgi:hypothetical protein
MGAWNWIKGFFGSVNWDDEIVGFVALLSGESREAVTATWAVVQKQVAKAEAFTDLPGAERRAWVLDRLKTTAYAYLPVIATWLVNLLLELAVARMRRK